MNIINAIIHLSTSLDRCSPLLLTYNQNRNRANAMGDALEDYIKDLFSGSLALPESERSQRYSEVFSYLGNNNNPPDMMLKGGDAIEVKKIENAHSALALNSSYPKSKLLASSPMISKHCREAEQWTEKDLIYTVGVVDKNNNHLKQLAMVYGEDYCADESCYLKIKSTIKAGVESIMGVDFAETKELGRVNRIDPLGITYLRVRGMWGIENPWTVFRDIYPIPLNTDFHFMAIINEEKWRAFDNKDDLLDLCQHKPNMTIAAVKIKNPNNPAQLKTARLITLVQ